MGVYSFFEDEKSYKSKLSNISLNDEVAKSTKSSSNQSKVTQNSENSENRNAAPLVPLPRKVRQRRHQYFDEGDEDEMPPYFGWAQEMEDQRDKKKGDKEKEKNPPRNHLK